jgi:hypothetical protein
VIAPTSMRNASSAATDTVIEALFAEARRRRRRIRLATTGAVAALAAIALSVSLTWPWHGATRHHRATPGISLAVGPAAGDPRLAWVTTDGAVMIGNLRTMSMREVGEADVDPAVPLIPSGGLIYWVKESGGFVDGADWPRVVEALNPSNGTNSIVAPGEYLIPSANGQRIYAVETDTSLAQLPTRPGQRLTQLTVPAGWYLAAGEGLAVANGITVQSKDVFPIAHPSELGVWNPRTGQVRSIGRAEGTIAAYTPPGAYYSLLAWMPASCKFPDCPITITNTATLASRTLRSSLPYGFVLGGAFSPNGQQLAVFINDSGQAGGEEANLAIASTTSGAVRVVRGVRMTVGIDTDWVKWLSDSTLVTLANSNYMVNATTLVARPFSFRGDGQGINYDATLIPAAG